MEAWKVAWREGFESQMSTRQLDALRHALANDDPRLIQGATTAPPPLVCMGNWPVEGACAVSLCGWQGDFLTTVSEVEEFFATKCREADARLGEPAACRHFLNFWDDTPRKEAVKLLLEEVEAALDGRREAA